MLQAGMRGCVHPDMGQGPPARLAALSFRFDDCRNVRQLPAHSALPLFRHANYHFSRMIAV